MLSFGTILLRKGLFLSKTYSIAKFMDKNDNWGKIKQDEYKSYFQIHQNSISDKVKSIIYNLGSGQTNFIRISQNIEQFIKDIQQQRNFRSPLSYIYLLVALQMRQVNNIAQLRNSKEKIVQLLYRSDWQDCIVDIKALLITIKTIQRMSSQLKIAKKYEAARSFIFLILFHNFNNVTPKEIRYIIQLLHQEIQSAKLNLRSQKIVDLLFARIHQLILDILAEDLIADQHKFMFQTDLIIKLSGLYNFFKTDRNQYIDSFYRFATQRLIPHHINSSNNTVMLCNEIYRSAMPSNMVNSQSQNYKKLMLQWIIKLYQSNQSLMKAIRGLRQGHHFCYTIITHFYDIAFQALPVQIKNGLTQLKAIQLKPPTLPNIFWQLYGLHYKNFNKYPVIFYAIKNSYPQHLKIDSSQKPLDLLVPFVQTQMNARSYEALKKLKLNFISQTFIQGRFIDYFLPQENIILQIDGLRHFSRRQLKYNDSSNFRNLHFLLSGYKLIVINIFQYNIAREVEELSQLIQVKLDRIRSGAIYVD